ncbi:MAG: hypothetical protein ACPGLV_00605 [Bacteroidia bacterium]
MKDKPAISLIGGLTITAIILIVIALLYFLMTFNLAGGETFQEIEIQRTALLVLAIIIAVLTALVSKRFIRTRRMYTAIGTGILPLVTFIAVTVYYLNNYNYHTNFDQTTWQHKKLKPFDMATTLAKDNELIGMTRTEVKTLLGKGFEKGNDNVNPNKGFITYLVEQDWTLTIFFENDVAVEVKLKLTRMLT